MRIIWDSSENRFQAEISSEFWHDDIESIKVSGFRTTGPPKWIWYTSKISSLELLRKNPPKSGLAITELALEKYRFLSEQINKKKELKKLFEKATKDAVENAAPKWLQYLDEEIGVVCFVVEPSAEPFTWKYIPPPAPGNYCFMCGDPVYDYEGIDLCLWCSK